MSDIVSPRLDLAPDNWNAPAAYLCRDMRGLAGGSPWPCDFGPDVSRGFGALNADIVATLQESAIVAPSATVIDGRVVIRAAIFNHRTVGSDADSLIDAVMVAGNRSAAGNHGGSKTS